MSSKTFPVPDELKKDIARRVSEILNDYGASNNVKKFCEKYHIPQGTLDHYRKDGKVNISFYLWMVEEFQVNLHWLITGKGHPYLK